MWLVWNGWLQMDPYFTHWGFTFKYIYMYIHTSLIKNAFLKFMFLYFPETLSDVYCCKSKYELSPVFFFLSTLTFWEVTLTVTYMHNSSYVLFMAFQQLCNPRGWKYFPFATVTRAAEKKYEQLQPSLMVGSDNTLFRISGYLFPLKEKAASLVRASPCVTLGLWSSGSEARASKWNISTLRSWGALTGTDSAYFNHLLLTQTCWL